MILIEILENIFILLALKIDMIHMLNRKEHNFSAYSRHTHFFCLSNKDVSNHILEKN